MSSRGEHEMLKSSIRVAQIVVVVMAFSGWGLLAKQAAAPAPTVTRTVLNQQDLPVPGFAAAMVRVDLPVGAREGRHQHPGTLIAMVQEGTLTLDYEGKPTMQYKVGETFYVESGKIHEGMNKGTVPVKLIASFVFPKDKPMTIQVP
jgi:quercetin dioxygenase-like cupin family protein